MKRIVGYFPDKETWRKTDEEEYRRSIFSHNIAIHYLKHEIQESVEREMNVILSGTKAGFYAGLRFLFAEVNGLACLYWGKDSDSKNCKAELVVEFMRKFGILQPTPGLHYEVFRHGLMHSHHPKWIKKNKKVIGWYIDNEEKRKGFGVYVPEFRDQVISSIKEFIAELEKERDNKEGTLLNRFRDGLIASGKILTKKDLKEYAKDDYEKLKV